MIFKKLTLKNFMSYSVGEIDFSSIHTACLTGNNGAGKSSLLDAITWTIWECGRAKTDELIKLGTDEMSCELEFFMEEDLFRIYRSRTKSKKNSQGKSNLEFQVYNPEEKNWTSLTRHTVRQTEELIKTTLKMDYDTFINSVYLKQGKADEFTVKKPTERKQILADIIGLSIYDKLCEKAREKIKKIDQETLFEENLIQDIKNKIEKENEIKTFLEQTQGKFKIEEEIYKNTKQGLTLKEKELSEKKEKEKQISTLEKSKISQAELISTIENQFAISSSKLKKYDELIVNKEKITSDYEEYKKLQSELETHDKKKDIHNNLISKKNLLDMELKEKLKSTEQELAVYKSKINERSELKNNLNLKLKNETRFLKELLPEAEGGIKEFHLIREALVKIETEGQELKHKKELHELEIRNILKEKSEIEVKIKTLLNHPENESCPLCKGEIKDKKNVLDSYKNDLGNLNKKEEDLKKIISKADIDVEEKRKEYSNKKNSYDSLGKKIILHLHELNGLQENKIDSSLDKTDGTKVVTHLSSQIEISKSEYKRVREQLTVLEKEMISFDKEMISLTRIIENGSLVKDISQNLKAVDLELKEVNYNSLNHEKIKLRIKEKENINILFNQFIQAEVEYPALKNEVKKLEEKINQGKKEILSLEGIIKSSKSEIGNITLIEEELKNIKQEEIKRLEILEKTRKELVIHEQSLKEIAELKLKIVEKENKIKSALENKKHYEALEKAFSKNGIQVAIIETIVPEIEQEANRVLNKLTDNQMHIGLKTQREKKTGGGLTETLDIIIADNVGTRNYELYSGGEAFKINFSLRLALSRLLTNRAGAKLQSLIIDEGFGSQDLSGRERLVEIIKSIENEFELILIVTHLDELKDSFPSQIHVTKDDEGSKLMLVS